MDFNYYLKSTENCKKPEYSMMNYGDLHIECYNYKDKYTVTPSLIIKLLEKIPATHLLRLQEIIYEPILHNPVLVNSNILHTNLGKYSNKNKRILIGDMLDNRTLKKTLYHEIGHHLQRTGFGGYDHDKWISLSCNSEKYVSDYAKVSIYEDFAETYSCYLTDPEKLRKISIAKFNFINDLFSNSPYKIIQETRNGWIA
jgi:hypothetical protein